MGVDLRAPFGTDIAVAPTSDVSSLGAATRDFEFLIDRDELIQRVLRRLLTDPGEWIPFPSYGAGLRRRVNEVLTPQLALQIRSDIVNQLLMEADVARIPPPQVQLATMTNGIIVTVFFYTQSLVPVSFSFNPASPSSIAAPAIQTTV